MDIEYRNNNRYYNYPPVNTDYVENPKPVLQKTEYAATEIQPMDKITETTIDITLSLPVNTDYAENLELVLQKIEYAAVEIQPWRYITETATDTSFFFGFKQMHRFSLSVVFQVCFTRAWFLSGYFSYMVDN